MRKLLVVLMVSLPQILFAQGKFSGFKGHSIFKIVSADSAETSYGVLFRDDVQFLANFVANLSSGEVTRFIAPGGDTLIIGPAGFLGTNSYAAGPLGFQYKDGTTTFVVVDTAGNYGLGTAAPTVLIHGSTSGATGAALRLVDTRASGADINLATTAFGAGIAILYTSVSTNSLAFGTNSTERIRIDSGGNFGLNTTAPRAQYSQEGSSPQAYWTDTDVNTTRATFAGATDSAAVWIDASLAAPTINIAGSDGDTWNLSINTSDYALFSNAVRYIFDTDLTITGDDLFMATNTLGAVLVADGTNFNPVVMSSDASIDAAGAVTLAAGITRDTEWDTEAEVQTAWGGVNIILATEIDASSEILAIVGDETGTGVLVFGTSPTITTSLAQDGDVADAGYLRLQNAAIIGWEASPAGTDVTLTVDASEIMQASGTFNAVTLTEGAVGVPNVNDNLSVFAATTSLQLLGVLSDEIGTGAAVFGTSPVITTSLSQDGDVADAGYLRLANAANIAWEASPAGTDYTLGVDASEILQASGTFNATTLTESANAVPNVTDNLSVFAATTSLQLLGVLSDETGTGALVFAASPTLTGTITADNITLADPGSSVNSYTITLQADNATTVQSGTIQVLFGADPYMRLSAPADGGAATPILDLKDQKIIIGNAGAGVDYQIEINGETTDGIIDYMEDEGVFRFPAGIAINNTASAPTALNARMYFQGKNNADADTLFIYNGTSWKAFVSL